MEIISSHTFEKDRDTLGPQHDFRVSHEDRAQKALSFFRAELPDARVTMHVDEDPTYCIVVEESYYSAERINSLVDSLDDIVARPIGADHYEDGAEVYFSA